MLFKLLFNIINIIDILAHGSYIGSIRIEANKPTQLPIDTSFHFGASTRIYTLREKPAQVTAKSNENAEDTEVLGLPDTQIDLDVIYIYFLNTN